MADFHYEYDAANKIFAVRVSGHVTDDEFRTAYAAANQYLEGREIRAALIDLSGVERFSISAAAIRQVSAGRPVLADPTPRYIVATEEHVFGMARMFQLAASEGRDRLHVVRSLEEAHDALGLHEPRFERLA